MSDDTFMPGAYTHITAINQALIQPPYTNSLSVNSQRIFAVHHAFVEFGAIAPDFPYLVYADSQQSRWADIMHQQCVREIFTGLVNYVVSLDAHSHQQDKAYAWLSGYLGHVVADLTIHPVIEMKVGPFEKNKLAHRVCEMNQDTHIWRRMQLGEIGHVERLSRSLLRCTNFASHPAMDNVIRTMWSCTLSEQCRELSSPDLNLWFNSFIRLMNLVEDRYRLFPFSRHVAAFLGLVYPTSDALDDSCIHRLATPYGTMDFDALYALTIQNILEYQYKLERCIYGGESVSWFGHWDLDTGTDDAGNLVMWPRTIKEDSQTV